MTGLGWNFWGFFLVAAVWCAAYFVWALRANRRDREIELARRREDSTAEARRG